MNGFKGRFSGTFYSNKISADVIYFADLVTHKKINIFEQNGNLIEKIDVKAIPYLESSWGFEMISNDTIIITVGNPIQLIYILNDKAEIVKQIVISEIQGNEKDKYTLDAPYQRTLYNNSKIYLSYRHFKDKEHFYTDYLYSRTYNDSLIQSPYITSIDIIEKKTVPYNIFHGIYNKSFSKDDSDIQNIQNFVIANNNIFFPIIYNSKVYIYNIETERLVKEIKLESKFTEMGYTLLKCNKDNYIDVENKMTDNMYHYSGSLKYILWDKYRKLYYFIIRHETKEKFKYKSFSIQIYDEKFNLKSEQLFDYNKYNIDVNAFLVTKEGLMINCNNKESKNYEKNIEKYTLFNINY